MTTTTGLDDQNQPLDRTSTFTSNQQVYIVYHISEAQVGEGITFTCWFNDMVCWEGSDQIAAAGNYTGYFVVGPLSAPGTYQGELAYRGERHTVSWEVR